MKKEYTLDHNEIDILGGIIEETLNRENLTEEEIVSYWNDFDQFVKDEAAYFGIHDHIVKASIIDELGGNFPKF